MEPGDRLVDTGTIFVTVPRVVCPGCDQSTWREGYGCVRRSCENHAWEVRPADEEKPPRA